jgi:hypothetical protein
LAVVRDFKGNILTLAQVNWKKHDLLPMPKTMEVMLFEKDSLHWHGTVDTVVW